MHSLIESAICELHGMNKIDWINIENDSTSWLFHSLFYGIIFIDNYVAKKERLSCV